MWYPQVNEIIFDELECVFSHLFIFYTKDSDLTNIFQKQDSRIKINNKVEFNK